MVTSSSKGEYLVSLVQDERIILMSRFSNMHINLCAYEIASQAYICVPNSNPSNCQFNE